MTTPPLDLPALRGGLPRRSLLGLGLAAGLAAAGVAGCAPGSGSDQQGPTIPRIELGEPKGGVNYVDSYVGPRAYDRLPFGDGSTTFTVVVPQDATVVGDWNANKTSTELERRTGVKINYQAVPVVAADGSSDMTKVNAMLASGQLPDAFLGIPFTASQLALYGGQGIFRALDDTIASHAPIATQMLREYPDLRTLTASSDGKLYLLPGVNDCFQCHSGNARAWISQTYLDRIGAKLPETTEDLRALLQELKGRNPSGKPGFLPLAGATDGALDTYFMNSFGYNPGKSANAGWLRVNNGRVEFAANTDEWRQGLRYLRQLSKDGTLTEAAFTMKPAELQQAGNKGQLGFIRAFYWGSFLNPMTQDADAPWRDYVAVPPVKGPDGVRYAVWDYFNYTTAGLQVTKACRSPETLVQWADYQMDLEATLWEYAGSAPTYWRYADKGQVGINGKQALYGYDKVWPAPAGESWSQYAVMYRSDDFRLGQQDNAKNPTFQAGLYQAGKVYEPFAQPKEQQLPPVIIPAESAAQVADTATAVANQVTVNLAKFALGQLDPDSETDWKAYLDGFTAMRLDDYLAVYQKAYETRPQ